VCRDNYDILEQLHFAGNNSDGATNNDYTMFVDYALDANEVGFIKILKTDKPHSFNPETQTPSNSNTALEISGFTEQNEALFKFTNKQQQLQQTFGISLKYWKAKQVKNDKDGSEEGFAEGAYLFMPNETFSRVYSEIEPDVMYE